MKTKHRTMPNSTYSHNNKTLPQGWELKTLGEVCELHNGYAFKSSSFMDKGIPVVRIGDIQNFEANTRNSLRVKESQEYENYKIQKGDLLIAMSGATTGKIGIYKLDDFAYLNQRVGNLKIKSDEILTEYRNFTLYALQDEIYNRAYGGAQPNISKSAIESLKIPLPPLEIQKKIVERLEKAFSHIDKASSHLQNVKLDIPRLKASLLKDAFSGKLTKSNAKTWELKTLGEVCASKNSNIVLNGIEKNTGKYQIYGAKGFLKTIDFYTMENESLGIVKDGAGVGRIFLLPEKSSVIGTMAYIWANEDINLKYLYYFFHTINFNQYISGSAIPHIYFRDYKKEKIPLPPLEIQKEIAQILESKFSHLEKLSDFVENSLQDLKKLKSSFLHRAFKGELV